MRFRPFLSLGLLAAALVTVGCGPQNEANAASATASPPVAAAGASQSDLPKLGAAPTWKLTRVDGTPISQAELKGKVVVVDFWATWCGPCRVEIPGYIEMQDKYEDQGLVIVGVSLDQQGPGVVKQFAERMKINYPLAMGDEAIIDAFGGIEAIPTTFLIDRDGQIRHRKVGAMETAEYEPIVRSLL